MDCYALISGFVGIKKIENGKSCFRFMKLWSEVVFYSLTIVVCFKVIFPMEISRAQLIGAVFPAMSMQYWYFTYYIPLLFLMPYLNAGLNRMSIKAIKKMVSLVLFFVSIIPWIAQVDYFGLNGGFSPFWLMILYLLGSAIRLEMERQESILVQCPKRYLVVVLCIIVLLQVLLRMGLDKVGALMERESPLMHTFAGSTSPFIILEAGILLVLFAKINLTNRKIIKIISSLGIASFGVYLIHDNYYIRNYIMMNSLKGIGDLNTVVYMIAMFGIAMTIYLICALIELGRSAIFKGVRHVYDLLTNKHDSDKI